MVLNSWEHGPVLPRQQTTNAALAQIAWLGFSGTVYPYRKDWTGPGKTSEPGGFSPLYMQIGTWQEIEPNVWRIKD
jgi:hypothetical protein